MVRGDEQFDEFYQEGYRRLVGQVFLLTGDLHDAEDIAQEAFTRAAARWEQIRGHDVPAAWVRRVAINLATDAARRARRKYTTSYWGFADGRVAWIRFALSDGRTLDLPAAQLQPIRGTSLKFWFFNPLGCADVARVSAYQADGTPLGDREVAPALFSTDPRRADPATYVPMAAVDARPSDLARVVDLRFAAGLTAAARTSILVALEDRGAHIFLKDGKFRYGLEHVIDEHWESIRARLDVERAAGRLSYTVRTIPAAQAFPPASTPAPSRTR